MNYSADSYDLALATVARVKRRISEVTILRLFAFYGNNAVAESPSIETTEPKVAKSTFSDYLNSGDRDRPTSILIS